MALINNNTELALWGGIECTINRVGDDFFDQLNYSGHYDRADDIDAVCNTGIQKIRYPVLWERHQPEKHTIIDWTPTRDRLAQLKNNKVDVIAGLVHHGSGPAFTDLLDPDFPYLLAAYAEKVAKEFPEINFYTPVNEPLTTARFSGIYGLWYPHKKDDAFFLRMLLNEIKGVVLSMQAIRIINPAAKLVQTEDLGKTYSTELLKYQADFENHRRWLTYDLLCGKVTPDHPLWNHFMDHEIAPQELEFFHDQPCVPDVFGYNHYLTSERFLDERIHLYPVHTYGGNKWHEYADVEAARVQLDEPAGLEVLIEEAWQRYKAPIAITEVHLHCHREDQLRWFNQVWTACEKLKAAGVQIEAVTAWAMLGSYGWNKLLTQSGGEYEPGVFDVRSGTTRATALAGYLKSLRSDKKGHHLIDHDGWWQRDNRFFQKPAQHDIVTASSSAAPVLIIGKNGTLGRAFAKVCSRRHLYYKLASRQECDISEPDSIEAAIAFYKPWAIINAAGFVRVDDAESEAGQCYSDNKTGAENIAFACNKHGIKLISFSTDLVFDGQKRTPYTEADTTNPLNVYGRSKAEAEAAILNQNSSALIIRTSAFFGPWDEFNFAHYVRKSLSQYERIQVANDVTISPTYVPHLAHAVLDLLMDDESGIWHLANEGEITWADFAYEVAGMFQLNRQYINAVPNEELNFPAQRPLYTVLGSSRGMLLPGLEEGLNSYMHEDSVGTKEGWKVSRA